MVSNSKNYFGRFPLVCMILFIHFPPLNAQQDQYRVETLPLKGEMINFSGTCFLQDSDGFIWFGSRDGLYRYCANGIKVFRRDPYIHEEMYRSEPGAYRSLFNHNILSLYEDSRGVMWVGTSQGLIRYNDTTETFRYFHPAKDSTVKHGPIYVITEDDEGLLWFNNRFGFSSFDWKTETFRFYSIPRRDKHIGIDNYLIYGIYSDGNGFLWLNSIDGLYRFEKATESLERIESPYYSWSDIYEDRSGRCWFMSDHGLFLFDLQDHSFERHLFEPGDPNRLRNESIAAMTEDHAGNIWIRTHDGLYCYTQDLEKKFYMEHNRVYPVDNEMFLLTRNLLVDKAGSVWYYTPDGVNQIISRDRNFKVYDSPETNEGAVYGIYLESRDRIWYGSRFGICSFDRGNNTYKLHYGSTTEESFAYTASCMTMDRQGTFWISLDQQGIFSMKSSDDPTGHKRSLDPGTLTGHPVNKEGLFHVDHFFEDLSGRLWIGFWDHGPFRLRYLDREKNMMVHLVDNPESEEKLPKHAIVMHETSSGMLWAFGMSGAFQITPPFTRISDAELMPGGVFKIKGIPNVRCSYLDSTATLWLGTSGKGLFSYSGQNLIRYTVAQGLASDAIKSILPDEKGNLWIGTMNGLSKFNVESGTFTNYYKRHGLPSNQFITRSAARGEDGELFFGTGRGMISFYPDSISLNRVVPPVKLTDFKIHNRDVIPAEEGSALSRSIMKTEEIELKYFEDQLSFEFAILNYMDPELNQYKYMLEGLEHDWVFSGSRNYATYANLDPGNYIFHVKGANNDGIWNEEGVQLYIRIHPPPWLAWYAYLTYGLLFTVACLGIIRFLKNRSRLKLAAQVEKIEKEKVVELDHLKSRFFANVSHEFRTPLTLILAPLEKLEESKSGIVTLKKDLASSMKRNARRLLQLINQLLDISRLEMGKMALQVSEGDLERFVRTITLSFLSLAESKQIHYTYGFPGTSGKYYFDADKLEKILTNLISNACKHTPAGHEVRIEMVLLPDKEHARYAEISIKDTGQGISPENLEKIFDRFYKVNDSDTHTCGGTGIGLALTKEIVELYRGNIHVESEVGRGSVFTVKLPISREQFSDEEIKLHSGQPLFNSGKPDHHVEMKPVPDGEDVMPCIETSDHLSETPIVQIVEDNPDLLNYISDILNKEYRIIRAENGRAGLELAIENIPDVIITDLMMPEMDGTEMCRQLQQDNRTNHIPVIILTAKAGRGNKIAGLETGAVDYLIKPFDAKELEIRVKNIIAHRQMLWKQFKKEIITEPDKAESPSPDDQLLQNIIEILKQHVAEPEFHVDQMSDKLNMSRMQMYRKVNALTGHTPMELLRTIRLKKAAALFENGHKNIAQVMYEVGFNNQSYFARCFRNIYKVNPSAYLKEHYH